MPIYKMEGRKDGKQKYRVRINYTSDGRAKQLDRVVYGAAEARALERRLCADMKSEPGGVTIEQLYREYIAAKKYEVRESSMANIKNIISHFVLPQLKNRRVDRLDARALQDWKNGIEELTADSGAPFSIDYKRTIYSKFNSMLNFAVKMGYVEKNPLAAVGNFRDPYEQAKEMDFYTPEEFKSFIAAARRAAKNGASRGGSINEWHYYVFFNIAFYTGMRKGEIYALRWSDIDGKIIRVRRSISQKMRGGDRETPPKNKGSVRDIQIPAPLMLVLDDHLDRCRAQDGFSTEWRICGGERCLRDTTLQNKNESYSRAAGVKTIRIHDFRHSHASLLANEGINIQEIARRLGHSNVNITWNVYSHLYPREEERAIKVLNNVL